MHVLSTYFFLFLFYFALFVVTIFQLGQIVYYRHKITSFHSGFLVHCFFWALIRSLFFLFADDIVSNSSPWLGVTIYWVLPINIQFSTFSFLVIYYAHLQQKTKKEWYELKKSYFILWAISNALMGVIGIGRIALEVIYRDIEPTWLTNGHNVINGIVFFALSFLLAWYAARVSILMQHSVGTQTKLVAKVSWKKILIITFILFVIFTTRCIYNFVSGSGIFFVELSDRSSVSESFLIFFMFFFFEIIPFVLVLILFGKIPKTTLGAFSKTLNSKIVVQRPKGEINSLLKSQMFNDPKRYDSDDETTPMFVRNSTSPLFYGGHLPTGSQESSSSPTISINSTPASFVHNDSPSRE